MRRRPPLQSESQAYAFLVDQLIDEATLLRAIGVARRWRCPPHEVLFALGWVTVEAYASCLAHYLGLQLSPTGQPRPGAVAIDATAYRPDDLGLLVASHRDAGSDVELWAASGWERGHAAQPEPEPQTAILEATQRLKRERPVLSAAHPPAAWQLAAAATVFGLLAGAAVVAPAEALAVLLGLITLPFAFVTVLRALAFILILTGRRPGMREPRRHRRLPDNVLPRYSVLVPLFEEADVVGDLVEALSALDWPVDRLEILLVLEAGDAITRERLNGLVLPPHMRVLIVPGGLPRTKPRACNFALAYARGDFVVVFDAEDVPDPDQLRRAFAVLRSDPERIGCVQACLNVYNPSASWLSAQYTLEYSALFDALMPALERFDWPIPLGGTSNHFPRRLLTAAGAWDPYNVTEDADLGLRLARRGWRIAVIGSVTWEEAPSTFGVWLRQRTRWLKGWMLTMLVHTRQPLRLMHELGEWRLLGLMAFLGSLVLAALIHPWFYLLLAVELWRGHPFELPLTLVGLSFWGLAAINLLIGYGVAMLLGAAAALRRGMWTAALLVGLLPVYWLLISLAAYRAFWQLCRDPYLWEKTPHASRRASQQRSRRQN